MSGVAKDETTPTSTSDETVTATGATETVTADTTVSGASAPVSETPADIEARAAQRRTAPHLRVVTAEDADHAGSERTGGPTQRIGAIIRAARENQGLTLEQVAKETRIHLSHLRAIEDMTPNLLGAPVYAKGYIRNYARHLKLDADDTLNRYLSECAILADPVKHEIAPPATARKLPVALPVLGLLVVALVGAAGLFFVFNGDDAAPAAGAAPADGSTAAAVAAAVEAPPLHIVALRRARIEVRSAAGDKFLARYMEPGEVYPPRVGAGWTVSTEDGSAFEWRLGDRSLGLVAAEGGPVYAQSVDLAAKREPVDLPPAPPVLDEATPPPATPAGDGLATSANPPPTVTRTTPAAPAAPSAAAGGQRPAANRPRPPAASPPPAQTQVQKPVVVTPPPAPVPTAPATPASDPALAAYPDN
jgi:cytoskeleton protein RodZ